MVNVAGTLKEKIENLPGSPGVYLYRDSSGKIVYVGKAKSLRNRVRSYFQEGRPLDPKTDRLVSEVADVECIVTDSEVEALILESTLAKKNQPHYNVNLKDDKSFPYLKLTVQEAFPRIFITRRIKKDGAQYFGPFLPASYARQTIKLINKYFRLRTCNLEIDGTLARPCLDYQMLRRLEEQMSAAAREQNYEAAAIYRDRLAMVRDISERQKMIMDGQDDA